MKCVVYVSREKIAFDEQSLTELADLAVKRNANIGITGYLYYDKGLFTQYVEGSADSIDVLLASLNRDSRHSILATYDATVDNRRFADWYMQKLTRNQLMEIQMEHVLTDHLLFMSRIPEGDLQNPRPLWRMVDTLSRLQRRISGGMS